MHVRTDHDWVVVETIRSACCELRCGERRFTAFRELKRIIRAIWITQKRNLVTNVGWWTPTRFLCLTDDPKDLGGPRGALFSNFEGRGKILVCNPWHLKEHEIFAGIFPCVVVAAFF